MKAYINCTQYDEKEARRVLEILDELGVEGMLDEDTFDGTFWSEKRWNLLREADLVIELTCTRTEYISHTMDLAKKYTELLNIPRLEIDGDDRHYHMCPNLGYGFRGSVWDIDIKEKLTEALSKVKLIEKNKYDKEKDLCVSFYPDVNTKGTAYYYLDIQYLNMRTHEVFDYHNNNVEKDGKAVIYSDFKVFEALAFLCDKTRLMFHSECDSYVETDEDMIFLDDLTRRHCKPPTYLINKHKKKDRFPEGYPYMDEFEYIDSTY